MTVDVAISYVPRGVSGQFSFSGELQSAIRDRLAQAALTSDPEARIGDRTIELSWSSTLGLIRDFSPQQRNLDFRFRYGNEAARARIQQFMADVRTVRAARTEVTADLSEEDIRTRLRDLGFTRRELRDFQSRDLRYLLSLPNGANFSVPGAGKTTVTLALHLLIRTPEMKLLVVAPKSAFPAWHEVVGECIEPGAPQNADEPFVNLRGGEAGVQAGLASGANRMIINYDQLIRAPRLISNFIASHPVHLVLDESHRMKAGIYSQRGRWLLNMAPLPVRRDILSGTPMPQGPGDMESQLNFLWPGHEFGRQIARGDPPGQVLGSLYVRTTKEQLGLRPPQRHFHHVNMSDAQLALYAVVKREALRQLSSLRTEQRVNIVGARRSVIRLLQLSVNPTLVLQSIGTDLSGISSGIIQRVLEEGPSTKMLAAERLAREICTQDEQEKVVLWTIFTDTIRRLETMLADLNPVLMYGGTPSGDASSPGTREYNLTRINNDPACRVLIANPAAAGEGISLHRAVHNAIYVDRSYVSTHYLQSVDRIHRLGLEPDVETHIHILQTTAPLGMGSVDYSVARRLRQKIDALQQLLNDEDLHRMALDEDDAPEPVHFGIEEADLLDLVLELEGQVSFNEAEAI